MEDEPLATLPQEEASPAWPRARRSRAAWLLALAAVLLPASICLLVGAWRTAPRERALHDAYAERARLADRMPFDLTQLAEADRRLAIALAEAERADGTWRLHDLVPRQAAAAGVDDVTATLRRIDEATPERWPDYLYRPIDNQPADRLLRPFGSPPFVDPDSLASAFKLPPPTCFAEAQMAEFHREMATVARAVDEARRLARQPAPRLTFAWPEDLATLMLGETTLDPAWLPSPVELSNASVARFYRIVDVHDVSRVLTYDVLLRAQAGDVAGALTSCRALLGLGAAFGTTPTLGAQEARRVLAGQVLHCLERVLALGTPAPADLADLQAHLTTEADAQGLLLAARGERAAFDALGAAISRGELPPERLLGEAWVPLLLGDEDALQEDRDQALTLVRAILLERFNRKVEMHKLPIEMQAANWEMLVRSLAGEPRLLRPLLAKGPNYAGLQFHQARLCCALTALGIERYRATHQRWPAALTDLIPEFLSAVPEDPFHTGQPLGYLREQAGVAIYSVGRQVRTDPRRGQTGASLFDVLNDGRQTDKIGYRLWEPELRRQSK